MRRRWQSSQNLNQGEALSRRETTTPEASRPPLRRASLATSPPIDGGEEGRQGWRTPSISNQSPYLATNTAQPFAKLRAAAQHRQEISRTYLHLERGRRIGRRGRNR
ncbi:hypothetical protein EJ077_31005 [Mesorhizobium sp. M8A.F.Ca.ET.057.01.1.1]|nr:hypothetical protein EJ077_31005 [Mesorhizobium sp. M8A.F.Ca.ET.057.01.1.1]RWE47801.1 MAG: hypothetical protein EOS80_06820 [Mesorhizobium sp.]